MTLYLSPSLYAGDGTSTSPTSTRESVCERWSPQGFSWPQEPIFKSLASKLQVLENCPVLGSRIALFFESLKFVGKHQKPRRKFAKTFFVFLFWKSPEKIVRRSFFLLEIARKKFLKIFFFWNTCACVLGSWPRAFLFLASRGSVLERAVLGLGLGFFVVLALVPSLVFSTPPLASTILKSWRACHCNICIQRTRPNEVNRHG